MQRTLLPAFILGLLFNISCSNKQKTETTVQKPDSVSTEPISAPALPEPSKSHILFSKVVGWSEGRTPIAPAGFTVTRFADKLDNPRQVYVSADGDVFVSMANTENSVVEKVENAVVGKAKSQNNKKSANQVILFRNGDPKQKSIFLKDLSQPFGMLVLNDYFYVANTDGLWRYSFTKGQASITTKGEKILELPAGGYNNHWTRNLLASKDGSKIYVSVGSGSNVGEMEWSMK